MRQKMDNWQRIDSVIRWANMTINYFALYIGLPRGENLYQIKKGKWYFPEPGRQDRDQIPGSQPGVAAYRRGADVCGREIMRGANSVLSGGC